MATEWLPLLQVASFTRLPSSTLFESSALSVKLMEVVFSLLATSEYDEKCVSCPGMDGSTVNT